MIQHQNKTSIVKKVIRGKEYPSNAAFLRENPKYVSKSIYSAMRRNKMTFEEVINHFDKYGCYGGTTKPRKKSLKPKIGVL